MKLIGLMIFLSIVCGVVAIILYIFSIIILRKGSRGEDKKVKGILFVILATILAYVPLKYIFGLFILRAVMTALIGMDIIMIYKFVKRSKL